MCDTMAARGAATTNGATLFAKNSDRERNESQFLEMLPARDYGAGSQLRATYIAIAQARRTHAVLLSRPFWIWGAEMGANEHGVVIGNEAVHPRQTPQRKPTLIGMDLLRLGLERGATAREALDVITSLLEQHGQGGKLQPSQTGATTTTPSSSLIAARSGCWRPSADTGPRSAPATRARSRTPIRSVRRSRARATGSPISRAPRAGGARRGAFDLAAAVTNPDNPGLPGALSRCDRATRLLARHRKRIDVLRMMANLRDHGDAAEGDAAWHPHVLTGPTICMHAGGTPKRMGQSVGSLVSELGKDGVAHWVTGTSSPCTSVFKPVFMDVGLPPHGAIPGDGADDATLWWKHEQLHRGAIAGDYAAFMRDYAPARDALEATFRDRVADAIGGTSAAAQRKRTTLVAQCWREAAAFEASWLKRVARFTATKIPTRYRNTWQRFDALAGATPARA